MFNKMTALIALLKKINQLRTWQIQPILLDGATSIDEAVRLTIEGMPNALRLLENS